MIDLRLYRYALLLVPLAAVIAMFSLKGVPQPLSPSIPPDAFDPATAAPLAKQLSVAAPNPTPGSASDVAMAERVKATFAAIDGVTVSEQSFAAGFHGHTVHLRNLIAVLPGESNRQIALIAPRDAASGSGVVTSVASTAALLEIAQAFSGTSHHKTLVFVSTDGDSIGALGAKRFVQDYSDSGLLDAAIVLSQPAVTHPVSPLVIPWSTGAQSSASQLAETADSTVAKEVDHPAGDEGAFSDLFRLALPAGLGEQGPLIASGVPAVRLSSDGELPLAPADDIQEKFSADTFDRFGRAALSLILALDSTPGAVQHGPAAYIGVAGNLLPGWTLAMFALALLIPVALAAGSGLASAARNPIEAVRGLLWATLRAVPFLGALLLLLAAATVGLMPSPAFPFDPRTASLGAGGIVTVVAAALAYCAIAFFLRPLRSPPTAAAATATPASLLLACLAGLGVWLVNPYLGLLVAVTVQIWLAAAAVPVGGRRWIAAGLVVVGLAPLVALVADLAGRFAAGAGVWHDLLLMVADGQIGLSLALLGCFLAGSAVAIVAASGRGPRQSAVEPGARGEISVRRQESPEPDLAQEPEEESEEPAEPEPEPAQPEPERDPRLWSKPRGSSSPPPGSRITTPFPSTA
jgi:peptidase M28-like protein